MTVSQSIMKIFSDTPWPLALHEIKVFGSSESAIGARIRELTQEGKLKNRFRPNENYKEWILSSRDFYNAPKTNEDAPILLELPLSDTKSLRSGENEDLTRLVGGW